MMRAAVVCLALLGCSKKHEPQTHQVSIKGMQFVPAELTVHAGDSIVWTNEDVLPHTVTSAPSAPKTFDSTQIEARAHGR